MLVVIQNKKIIFEDLESNYTNLLKEYEESELYFIPDNIQIVNINNELIYHKTLNDLQSEIIDFNNYQILKKLEISDKQITREQEDFQDFILTSLNKTIEDLPEPLKTKINNKKFLRKKLK